MNPADFTLIDFLEFCEKEGLNLIKLGKKSKRPTEEWLKYKKERTNFKEWLEWFNQGYNLGIVCGRISNNLVVLDFDHPYLFEIFFEKWKDLLNETLVVETAKGIHVYLKTEKEINSFHITFKKDNHSVNIDVIGNGYIIAPFSTHPTGVQYKIISKTLKIKKVNTSEKQIKENIRNKKNKFAEKGFKLISDIGSNINEILNGVEEGRRNISTFTLALRLKRAGIDFENAVELILNWNKKNKPPLPEKEVLTTIKSAYKIRSGNKENYYNDPERLRGFNFVFMAEEIKEDVDLIVLREYGDILYKYDGIYKYGGEEVIAEICKIKLPEIKKDQINEVIFHLKNDVTLKIDPQRLNCEKHLIPLENGVYDFKNDKFMKYEETNAIFTFRIPIKYNPNADCPKIKKFISEIVREDDIKKMFEFIGYCLYRDYPIQKAFFLIGEGENGKSTFLRLLDRFLGRENICSISMQELGDRFSKLELKDKLANIFPDLSKQALGQKSTGMFKMLTGGDLIQAERKFGGFVKFVNYAKLIFSANALPLINEDTYAFFRRIVLIEFPNKFTGEKADKNLIEKITTEEELSGLFNEAVKHLKELLEKGEFHNFKNDIEKIKKQYTRLSDSVGGFIIDCIEYTGDWDDYLLKDEIYETYKKYCENIKARVVSKGEFTKRFQKYIKIEEERRRFDNGRKMIWLCLKFKENMPLLNNSNGQGGLGGQGGLPYSEKHPIFRLKENYFDHFDHPDQNYNITKNNNNFDENLPFDVEEETIKDDENE